MFLLLSKITFPANESLLMSGFERFWDEDMIKTDRDVLHIIILITMPVQIWYSSTSKNRAWRSIFHSQVLRFQKLFLIQPIKVPEYPSTTSRTKSPLLSDYILFYTFKKYLPYTLRYMWT